MAFWDKQLTITENSHSTFSFSLSSMNNPSAFHLTLHFLSLFQPAGIAHDSRLDPGWSPASFPPSLSLCSLLTSSSFRCKLKGFHSWEGVPLPCYTGTLFRTCPLPVKENTTLIAIRINVLSSHSGGHLLSGLFRNIFVLSSMPVI